MPATNIREFQLGIAGFANGAEKKRRQMTKAVALRALRGVVLGTRVDTGRARGNWQVGEGAPPTGQVERLDPSGGETVAIGSRQILAMEGDDVIWLHNGVPYIGILEDRDKMVAGNVEALRTWLERR